MSLEGGCVMSFSEFVKEVRRNLNLSQKQLAQALNVNYTTINRWENEHVIPSNLARKIFFDLCESNFISIPDDLQEKESN
jgi:DNA-binding XRE family transcriptional regulator